MIFVNCLARKLTRHGSENTCPNGFFGGIDEYRRILIKLDIGTVRTPHFFLGAHHHRSQHIPFLDLGIGNGFLNRNHDNVAHRGITFARTPEHLDAVQPLRA